MILFFRVSREYIWRERRRYRAKDERELIQCQKKTEKREQLRKNDEWNGRKREREREDGFGVMPIEIGDYHAKVYPSFFIHLI